ncbi:MAG: helix-turn-helix domain-containing protein [Trebonia sp.]
MTTLPQSVTMGDRCGNLSSMVDNPASHFGRQLKKERLGHGWSLDDLARETGIHPAHLSRIENGHRPPTEKVAKACDAAFPTRRGWFTEYWTELQRWTEVPSWFRPWAEYEMNTTKLHVWSPGVVDGLLQTEDYARVTISSAPMVAPAKVVERVANRMARQKRVLFRDEPPTAWFLVDVTSLRRMSPRNPVMSAQLRRLLEVAALPNVTFQVVPECMHAGLLGGFIVADGAAYAESVHAGQVYADEETVSLMNARFDSIRSEAMRASESQALIREMLARERLAKVKLLKRPGRGVRGDGQR